jgi:hypothetical protein
VQLRCSALPNGSVCARTTIVALLAPFSIAVRPSLLPVLPSSFASRVGNPWRSSRKGRRESWEGCAELVRCSAWADCRRCPKSDYELGSVRVRL